MPVSVRIKNATFGVKWSILQKHIQAHDTFCYICSNFPSFHGPPWRGRGGYVERERERERVTLYIMSGVLMGAPPSHRLLSLHNQVCCFQPCFQLSHTEGNLLALISETLEITLHADSSECFSWMLFNKPLNLHCHCNHSRRPMQLARRHCVHYSGRESGWNRCVSQQVSKNLTTKKICIVSTYFTELQRWTVLLRAISL